MRAFDRETLPYGAAERDGRAFLCVAVEDRVLDLGFLGRAETSHPNLDWLLRAGPETWREVRHSILDAVSAGGPSLDRFLHPMESCRLSVPYTVGDYVDFYSSIHHAQNLGRLFRPDAEPLLPNWRHLPVGYHGRAGTVLVSGTPIRRPCGQRRGGDGRIEFGPSVRLDIEAEIGFLVGAATEPGVAVSTADFERCVFGLFVVNDWSARDIQAWEYQPLGPFLGKSFATSVSPWVIPLDALARARVAPPPQAPEPLPYLRSEEPWGLDITLEVTLNGLVISRPPFAEMYWTPDQQLAHMTVNGARLRPGDIYASGTVSGPAPDQCGSLIEITLNGARPLPLPDGEARAFLEDGDTVEITAVANGEPPAYLGSVVASVGPAAVRPDSCSGNSSA